MNQIKKIAIATILASGTALTITSCADGSYLRTGPALAPTSPASIRVLTEKPTANYTTLGLVESEMNKGLLLSKNYTAAKALEEVKQQAAKLGANAIIVRDYSSSSNDAPVIDGDTFPIYTKTKRIKATAIYIK